MDQQAGFVAFLRDDAMSGDIVVSSSVDRPTLYMPYQATPDASRGCKGLAAIVEGNPNTRVVLLKALAEDRFARPSIRVAARRLMKALSAPQPIQDDKTDDGE